jgi:hypothetical protein
MAYDWGGWDSIDGYQSYMRQGFQAGDINTKQPASGTYSVGVETCSRGVDCSGFVTRALGISSQKYSTTTLSNISTALPDVHSVKPGDLLVKPTRHSAVVDTISADQRGVWVYESTTFAASDRVIHVYHDWSYYNGYDLRRYTNLCDP